MAAVIEGNIIPTQFVSPRLSTSDLGNGYGNQCSVCLKCFDRKDTLKRHVQIHSKPRRAPKPRKRACEYCIRSKIRCRGERPCCSSCSRRGTTCVYETSPRSEDLSMDLQLPGHPPPLDESQISHVNDSVNHEVLPSADVFEDFSKEFVDLEHYSPTLRGRFDLDLDWIFSTNLDDGLRAEPSTIDQSSMNGASYDFQLRDERTSDGSGAVSPETLTTDDRPNRFPNLTVPPTQDSCSPDDPWPMEWHAAPIQSLVLPPLGSDELYRKASGHFQTLPVTSYTRTGLQDSLQLPLEHIPWQAVSLSAFPSKEKLDHCIDLYFTHYDTALPVIHRPTFDPAKEPVVTLAMACIGACYTEFDGAQAFSNSLSELIRRLLLFMAEVDPRFVRTESYVTAKLLQGAHGYASGSRRLFELSESYRSSLVHHARCMGLFRSRDSTCPPGATLEERWHAWIRDERFRRLGWGIYGYDSSASYLFNARPHTSISEISVEMQCSTEHWEADSMHAWAALHPWTNSIPINPRFRPLIRSFMDGTAAPHSKLKDDHHRLPIILTLIRMIWSIKEFEANPISDYLDHSSRNVENRKRLLNVLDGFMTSPKDLSAMYTSKSLVDIVHRLQTIHMAHLLSAGDMMDWLYPLLRDGTEASSAKSRMLHWAKQDPARLREVAYHSAQVLSIIRQYPYNLPQESWNVFYAGALLWCIAGIFSSKNDDNNQSANLPDTVESRTTIIPFCHLDYIGSPSDSEITAIRAWINNGGPTTVRMRGVTDLYSTVGRRQILEQTAEILRRMRVWGIAQNFLKVVLTLMQKDHD